MKSYLFLILLCAASILLVPMAMVNTAIPSPRVTETFPNTTSAEKQPAAQSEETISVFRTVSNKTEEISAFEYICGSVAAEMPLAYNEEALKAQAVACYTNALRQKQSGTSCAGDISDDTSVHQGYIDLNQRKEKWGKDFEKYEKKLEAVVKEVEGEILTYNDAPCVAAFCAISNGNTENAENLWNTKVPYLVSVESEGDPLSPAYASTVSFPKDDFLKIIKDMGADSSKLTSLEQAIKIAVTSDSGTVLKAKICGKEFTGEQIRKAFSLRSPTFSVKATENAVTFSVSGYGHGIGMSQYGANYYAEKGWDYKKILMHYYSGAEITRN